MDSSVSPRQPRHLPNYCCFYLWVYVNPSLFHHHWIRVGLVESLVMKHSSKEVHRLRLKKWFILDLLSSEFLPEIALGCLWKAALHALYGLPASFCRWNQRLPKLSCLAPCKGHSAYPLGVQTPELDRVRVLSTLGLRRRAQTWKAPNGVTLHSKSCYIDCDDSFFAWKS